MLQTCKHCPATFEVTDADLAFYDKVSPVFQGRKEQILPPTLCPDCRMQRRLTFRNERSLHHRSCSRSGKSIISMYPADVPFPVFDNDEWWKDGWSGVDYGLPFLPGKPFFTQFAELMRVVPRMARVQQGENPNSQYTNCASNNRNCYLIFSSNADEDCLYGTWVNDSKDCVDCQQVLRCERCYECIDCVECYNCAFVRDSAQCSDSRFLISCVGCRNCFGCVGLRQKEYCVLNEQLTKEEYDRRMAELRLDTTSGLGAAMKAFRAIALRVPVRHYEGQQNENVLGNHITQSKNAIECFDSNSLEDCKWCTNAQYFKDSYDVSYYGSSGSNELIYEAEGVGHNVSNVRFSKLVWGNSNGILYCYECFACRDCIGCIGLRQQQYCILNRQYSKDEYERLAPQVIETMRMFREWSEFFPAQLSPFGYNESVASEYFPLTKADAESRQWPWRNLEETEDKYFGPDFAVPDAITSVPDDITKQILKCVTTGKLFKVVPQELAFYRSMGLPIPQKCPDQRHADRMAQRNPRTLWDRTCANCATAIRTTYAPDRPEIVYCERCYLQTVY